jgi:hypothetical protein
MSKPGGDPSSGISSGEACPSGIRHVGGAKLNQALGRNSLAQAMPQTPGGTAISVRHAYAVAASGLISDAPERADCPVVAMKRGNARGAKGVGHRR